MSWVSGRREVRFAPAHRLRVGQDRLLVADHVQIERAALYGGERDQIEPFSHLCQRLIGAQNNALLRGVDCRSACTCAGRSVAFVASHAGDRLRTGVNASDGEARGSIVRRRAARRTCARPSVVASQRGCGRGIGCSPGARDFDLRVLERRAVGRGGGYIDAIFHVREPGRGFPARPPARSALSRPGR